jgi:hypothetical protein
VNGGANVVVAPQRRLARREVSTVCVFGVSPADWGRPTQGSEPMVGCGLSKGDRCDGYIRKFDSMSDANDLSKLPSVRSYRDSAFSFDRGRASNCLYVALIVITIRILSITI